jgi:hypothetical protein
MNSKERKFLSKLPADLKAIIEDLPPPVAIESFDVFGSRWRTRIRCTGRCFELVSSDGDLGYIDLSEILPKKSKKSRPVYIKIMPPDDQRMQITPAQVSALLRQWLAEPYASPSDYEAS